jgi:hypothetical protein
MPMERIGFQSGEVTGGNTNLERTGYAIFVAWI